MLYSVMEPPRTNPTAMSDCPSRSEIVLGEGCIAKNYGMPRDRANGHGATHFTPQRSF